MWALLIVLALAAGCRDDGRDTDLNNDNRPTWLATKTAGIEGEAITNPPTRLYRFRYNDAVVYYRPPRCCDMFGELYDANGEIICHPDGGIAGRGDGRCADFFGTRSDCELIWFDPRAKAGGADACQTANRDARPEF